MTSLFVYKSINDVTYCLHPNYEKTVMKSSLTLEPILPSVLLYLLFCLHFHLK